MWATLINSLTDRPDNHPIPRGNPFIHEMQAEKRELTHQLIIDTLKKCGGAATAGELAKATDRSYKYVAMVCNVLLAEGKVITYNISDGKARRKYWKLV